LIFICDCIYFLLITLLITIVYRVGDFNARGLIVNMGITITRGVGRDNAREVALKLAQFGTGFMGTQSLRQ
jgi:hypothetical protein